MSLLCFFFSPIRLSGNSQCANYAEESAHYARFLSQQNTLFAITTAKKKFTVGDGSGAILHASRV